MPVHANVFFHEGLAIERDHGDRRIVPAGNISPRLLPVFEEYNPVWIDVPVELSSVMQIDPLHFSRAVQVADNGYAVTQIVGSNQRAAVLGHREAGGVECRFPSVVVLWRHFPGIADQEKRRGNFCARPGRSRLDRSDGFRIEAENPHLVFESAGNIHRKTALRRCHGCKSQPDIRALRRGEIDVLRHSWLGRCVQVDHRNRLLCPVGVIAKLHAKTAVHNQQIAAFSVVPELVRAPQHGHGHGPHGRKFCSRIHHERAGGCNGPAFSRRLLLPAGDSRKQCRRKEKPTAKAECHECTCRS